MMPTKTVTYVDERALNVASLDGSDIRVRPTKLRSGSFLTIVGEMRFDSADLQRLEVNNRLRDVIIHEMGHVLGFGRTVWTLKNLLEGSGGLDPRFLGAQAAEEYRSILGSAASDVPIENTGGSGTRDSHWRDSVSTTN